MELNTEEEDRLSSLPEAILIHILSFLPSADAVRTMLVKTLWTEVSNLDFRYDCFVSQYSDIYEEDVSGQIMRDFIFFNFVRNVLNRHQTPQIDIFRVRIIMPFFWDHLDGMNLAHEFDSWVNFALRNQVKILEFMARIEFIGVYNWPDGLFSDSLIELKLQGLSLNSLTRVRLSSLRILRLVMVQLNDNVLGEIIRGCPVLKELGILLCEHVHMLSFDAPNIEKLTVISLHSEDFDEEDACLALRCPNLKSLDFTGFVGCVNFIDLSSIVDVWFTDIPELSESDGIFPSVKGRGGGASINSIFAVTCSVTERFEPFLPSRENIHFE